MPLILPGNVASATAGAYSIANSCRFDDGDTAYLSRTPGSDGNKKTFTISMWIKRGTLGTISSTVSTLMAAGGAELSFYETVDPMKFYINASHGHTTTALFRDTSSWYHIMQAVDTTQGAADDRIKTYVNGIELTSFSSETTTPINTDSLFSSTSYAMTVSKASASFDGYMAEVIFIDGQQLAPTSFGEFDEDSPTIWKPIDPSGLTFGTNGFWLDFEDSSALGNDVSGNNNDMTVTDLVAADQCTDSPTNNFCTLNPLDNYYWGATLSEGNCKVASGSNETFMHGTFGVSKGKWYWEYLDKAATSLDEFGFSSSPSEATNDKTNNTTSGRKGAIYNNYSSGGITVDGTSTTSGFDDFTTDSLIGVYMDLDNNLVYFAVDGTIQNSGTGIAITAAASTNTGFYFPAIGEQASGTMTVEVNFGNPVAAPTSAVADANGYGAFEYSPNDGGGSSFDSSAKNFYALCTKNLAEFGG